MLVEAIVNNITFVIGMIAITVFGLVLVKWHMNLGNYERRLYLNKLTIEHLTRERDFFYRTLNEVMENSIFETEQDKDSFYDEMVSGITPGMDESITNLVEGWRKKGNV